MTVERHLILQAKALPASAEWPPQTGGWLCLRLAAGQGYWLQSGVAVRSLSAGDVLLMGGQGSGTLRASQLGPLHLHYFTVMPQMLTGVLSLTESRQFELARLNPHPPVRFFTAKEAIAQKFAALAGPPEEEDLASRCGCLQLWAEAFSGLLASQPEAAAANDKLRGRFRQLVGRIPQTELATQSLTDLAAQLHCSERHFSRLFREQFGGSLRSRQIELRLEHARQLLANSHAKIINVAYESGYRHVGLFNSMFKKRFGLTPSEWRRQHLKKNIPVRPAQVRRSVSPILSRMALILLLGLSAALTVQTHQARATATSTTPQVTITTSQVDI